MQSNISNVHKVAVIGAGYWGKNLVRNFHGLGALGLIVDPNPVIQEKMTQDYPGITICDSYTEALSDPDIRGSCHRHPCGNPWRSDPGGHSGRQGCLCRKTFVPLRKRRPGIDSTGR